MTTKVSFSHVSYIPSLPSSGDCLTLYVEADFSMDGSDLLTSQLTSESCPCDLKGFYILYSHIHTCICISPTLTLHLYLLCTDKTWLFKKQQLKSKWYSMVNTIIYLSFDNKTTMVLGYMWHCSYCICLLVWWVEL